MGYVQEIQKTRQTSKTKHTPPPVLAQPEKETVRKQERGKEQPMNRRIITVCENFKEFTDFLLAELNKEPLEEKYLAMLNRYVTEEFGDDENAEKE